MNEFINERKAGEPFFCIKFSMRTFAEDKQDSEGTMFKEYYAVSD